LWKRQRRAGDSTAFLVIFFEEAEMPTLKFDERVIARELKPDPTGSKPVIYWDGGVGAKYPGLGVIVSPRGTRTWVVQAKLPIDDRAVRKKLARLEHLTLKEAWKQGQPEIGKILRDVHPRAEKRRQKAEAEAAKRAAKTVAQAVEEYIAASGLRASSVAQYRSYLAEGGKNRHVGHLRPWANRPLREITSDDVTRRYDAIIAEVRSRTHRGGKGITGLTAANLAMTVFSAAWGWASNGDATLPKCPTWVLAKRMEKRPARETLIEEHQLATFYEAAMRLPELKRDMVVYALFTGARLQECQGLLWSEVNFDKGVVTIGADRMKAGKQHSFPMTDVVRDILVRRRGLGDGKYVFVGVRGHSTALPFALRDIAKMSGVKVSPHDLRRSFVTIAESTEGLSVYQLKRLVAHAGGGGTDVTSGYIRMQEGRLAAGAQLVANRLKELCGFAALPDNVVAFGG
jgi:integrase